MTRLISSKCLPGRRRVLLPFFACLLVGVQWAIPFGHAAGPPPPLGVPDPIEGIWLGTITAPQGSAADIGFEFVRAGGGALTFKLNFPEMFTYAVPFEIPVDADGRGHYSILPAFDVELQLAGDRLTGTFGKGRLPLVLRRGGRFPAKPPARHYPAPPAPLWKFNMGGGTWAPPVVAGDRIYVGTGTGLFHAVHARDGTPAWSWKGPNGIDGRAVVGADTVYVLDTRTNLIALDRASGSLRWLTPLHDEKLAGAPVPDNPTFNHRAATPLLLDGVVYCGSSDGGVYAIDASTGTKLWRYDAKAPVFSGVGLYGDQILMFGTMDGSVVLLNRHTRQEVLRVRTGGGVVTTPVVAAGRLIVGSRDYMLYGFNLADGTLAWRFSYWFSWVESTPVLAGGLIYVGASDYSRVTAIDPATGKARWGTPVHGMNWGTPLVTEDMVFTGTVSQNIAGTAISHVGGIMALDRATGAVKWQLPAAAAPEGGFGGYAGSLALAGATIVAAGFDGFLVALPAG